VVFDQYGEDEDVQSEKSYQSASDYEGDLANTPSTLFFGQEQCRALYTLKATGQVIYIFPSHMSHPVSTIRPTNVSTTPGPGDTGYFPPPALYGPDPETESYKLYGLKVGAEVALCHATGCVG
jgi:hypothetical protein